MVELGRALQLPRTERRCPFCQPAAAAVEDEHHMIFGCPIYAEIRELHGALFRDLGAPTVAAFLGQVNQEEIAEFIFECREKREELRNEAAMGEAV